MITAIITTVLGTLVIGAGAWMFKSRWLYVIVPKIHMITSTNDKHVVSLSILNAGLLSEDNVKLTLRPSCTVELIAVSKSTVTFQGHTISVSKLARNETITVLLRVDGRKFGEEDIETIESTNAHGKIVATKEKAHAAWQYVASMTIALLVLVVPFLLGTSVGAEMKQSMIGYFLDRYEMLTPSKQLAGFKVVTREKYAYNELKGVIADGRLVITVKEILRRGDVLTLTVDILNNTGMPLMAEASLTGTAGKGNVDFWETRVNDFGMSKGESKVVSMKVYLPETTATKIIQANYSFKSLISESVTVEQTINFE